MSTLAVRHELRCPAGKLNIITTTLAYDQYGRCFLLLKNQHGLYDDMKKNALFL